MVTFLLAWINAKYEYNYELLFLAAIFIDFEILFLIEKALM